MDIGIFVGVAVALGSVILGNVLEGGHLGSLVGGPAALIVLGGTIGAVIIQFPLPLCATAAKQAGALLKRVKPDTNKVLDEIVDYAQRARKDGILGLEKVASNASHPFLSKGILMAVDGSDSNVIRSSLEIVISQEEEHTENSAKVFEAAGGYAPTVGIIGAVLGLIHVMSNLSDINAVGSGIAAAFVATIYGVAAANIFFLPLAGRIKTTHQDETRVKELMLAGVLAIQEGLNPKLVRERLSGYVDSHGKPSGGAAPQEAKAAA
ncbi:MAG: flagellar motor protein [Polyangiaceae bacterium]